MILHYDYIIAILCRGKLFKDATFWSIIKYKIKKKIILKNVSWRKKRILSLSSNLKKFTHNLMLFLIQFF